MILVGVAEDHGLDPTVPWRDATIELDEEPVRVRPAVDQQAAAVRTLDEDGIALPDIEDRDARDPG